MCQVCRGGGGDNDEDEGGESEFIEATRVAETILRECTSDGRRETCSNGSATQDGDSVFSSNLSGEGGGHTPAGAETVPTDSGTEESSSSSSTAESVVSAPEAGPSGRAAHELRDFLPGQEFSRLGEGRTRGETRRLQEMAATAIDEAVCTYGQQAHDVREDAWALLAEAPFVRLREVWCFCALGTMMRKVEKAPNQLQLLRNPSTGSCGCSTTEQGPINSGTPAHLHLVMRRPRDTR